MVYSLMSHLPIIVIRVPINNFQEMVSPEYFTATGIANSGDVATNVALLEAPAYLTESTQKKDPNMIFKNVPISTI